MTWDDHALDDAIDRAVREAINVDADPTFDARVVDLIRRPVCAVWWPRLALVGALGMALAVSVVWIRTPGPNRIEPPVQSVQPDPTGVRRVDPAPHISATSDTGTTAAAPPARASSGRTRSRPPAAARSGVLSTGESLSAAAIGTGPPLEIEALTPIEPIAVAPLQTRAITTEHIVIAPLSPIPDVHIEVLLQPEE
jgi:hypothetical protein